MCTLINFSDMNNSCLSFVERSKVTCDGGILVIHFSQLDRYIFDLIWARQTLQTVRLFYVIVKLYSTWVWQDGSNLISVMCLHLFLKNFHSPCKICFPLQLQTLLYVMFRCLFILLKFTKMFWTSRKLTLLFRVCVCVPSIESRLETTDNKIFQASVFYFHDEITVTDHLTVFNHENVSCRQLIKILYAKSYFKSNLFQNEKTILNIKQENAFVLIRRMFSNILRITSELREKGE